MITLASWEQRYPSHEPDPIGATEIIWEGLINLAQQEAVALAVRYTGASLPRRCID